MLVASIVLVPVEIAMAPEEQRARTATGAISGFVGGFALGATAGLICGPGSVRWSLGSAWVSLVVWAAGRSGRVFMMRSIRPVLR